MTDCSHVCNIPIRIHLLRDRKHSRFWGLCTANGDFCALGPHTAPVIGWGGAPRAASSRYGALLSTPRRRSRWTSEPRDRTGKRVHGVCRLSWEERVTCWRPTLSGRYSRAPQGDRKPSPRLRLQSATAPVMHSAPRASMPSIAVTMSMPNPNQIVIDLFFLSLFAVLRNYRAMPGCSQ